jgi:hypothetical protein
VACDKSDLFIGISFLESHYHKFSGNGSQRRPSDLEAFTEYYHNFILRNEGKGKGRGEEGKARTRTRADGE